MFLMVVFGGKIDSGGVIVGDVHPTVESGMSIGPMVVDVTKCECVVCRLDSLGTWWYDDGRRENEVLSEAIVLKAVCWLGSSCRWVESQQR